MAKDSARPVTEPVQGGPARAARFDRWWNRALLGGLVLVLLSYVILVIFTGNLFPGHPVKDALMQPSIYRGDLAIVKKATLQDLKVGDVIAFRTSEAYTGVVREGVHRVVGFGSLGDQNVVVTRGDAVTGNDGPIRASEIQGRVTLRLRYLGWPVAYLLHPVGFVFMLLLAALGMVFRLMYRTMWLVAEGGGVAPKEPQRARPYASKAFQRSSTERVARPRSRVRSRPIPEPTPTTRTEVEAETPRGPTGPPRGLGAAPSSGGASWSPPRRVMHEPLGVPPTPRPSPEKPNPWDSVPPATGDVISANGRSAEPPPQARTTPPRQPPGTMWEPVRRLGDRDDSSGRRRPKRSPGDSWLMLRLKRRLDEPWPSQPVAEDDPSWAIEPLGEQTGPDGPGGEGRP